MRNLLLAFFIVFHSLPALAQEKTVDKKFIFVSGFLVGSTIYDAETTRLALKKCLPNCREGNPLMRPFVSRQPVLYAVQGAIDSGVLFWSYRLKKDNINGWWLLPVVVGATHITAGSFNIRFIF